MDKLESKINGTAEIIFGGRIVTLPFVTRNDIDYPNIVVAFAETNEKVGIGTPINSSNEHKVPQVFLAFSDIKSIEIVQDSLEKAKQQLQEELEKYERGI